METVKESFWEENGFEVIKICISALFIALSIFLPVSTAVKGVICAAAAVTAGLNVITEIPESIKEKEFFGEDTLMFIACVVAFILGEYVEGAAIMTLFSLGELLEDVATDNSHKKIAGLAEIKSTVARLISGNGIKEVSPEEVSVGSIIEVRKGDRVPIDGLLIDGTGEFDLKAITGESRPYIVEEGGKVYGGAINQGNAVRIKTTEKYADSTAERIIAMVESSAAKKAKSQKFITGFAKIYTPCVIALALLISVVPPLFDGYSFSKWILKALNFMVVSCPCALVISVPLGYFVGVGALARHGILVKGAGYAETLAKTKNFAFDKTGTLTKGEFKVIGVKTEDGETEKEIMTALYALENRSSHPIAAAVRNYAEKLADKNAFAKDYTEISGQGVAGVINGKFYRLGNVKLLTAAGIKAENSDGFSLLLSRDNKIIARITLGDQVKDNAAKTVEDLKKNGAENFYILSGDEESAVKSVALETGIENAYSSLLPENKLKTAEKIISENGSLAYAGDGINDAPVLKLAGVGIAMGGLGSEAAIESADVVIMDDDLSKISTAYSHSKKIRKTVLTNIVCSIAVKIAIMAASVVISVPAYIAMFGDVGVMLLAVLNSLRCAKIKNK